MRVDCLLKFIHKQRRFLNRHEDILDLNILTMPHSKSHLILFFISSVIHPFRGYCPWGIAK